MDGCKLRTYHNMYNNIVNTIVDIILYWRFTIAIYRIIIE